MASANWRKLTASTAAGMSRHFETDQRIQLDHSNLDIRKDMTYTNSFIGCSSYHDAVMSMRQRVAEVDAVMPPARVRADRKVCSMILIPCPDEIRRAGRSQEFFESAYTTMQRFFGVENVHGGMVHRDEVHDYLDKDGHARTSLEHMHTLISNYVPGKGINGKSFETRQRLHEFNDLLVEMCRGRFGIEYNTGERPGRQSVETIKAETAAQEQLRQARADLREVNTQIDTGRQIVAQYDAEAQKSQERAEAASQAAQEAQERAETLQAEVSALADGKAKLWDTEQLMAKRTLTGDIKIPRGMGEQVISTLASAINDRQELQRTQKQLQRLQQDLDAAQDKVDRLSGIIDVKDNENQRLNKDLEGLKDAYYSEVPHALRSPSRGDDRYKTLCALEGEWLRAKDEQREDGITIPGKSGFYGIKTLSKEYAKAVDRLRGDANLKWYSELYNLGKQYLQQQERHRGRDFDMER